MTTIKPETSVWKRPMTLSPLGMFKAVGKLLIDGGMGNWVGVAKDSVDVVGALGIGTNAGDQAGRLVTRALGRAVLVLIDPYKMAFDESISVEAQAIAEQIDESLAGIEMEIDHQFLDHPRELAIVKVFEAKVAHWLAGVDLRGRSPATIAARLPEHFVYAVHRECVEHGSDYELLFNELHGQFDDAMRRERSWMGYRAWFERELAAPVFEDSFGLAQIFIWPRAYHVEGSTKQSGRMDRFDPNAEPERRVVGWLRDTLDAWMAGESKTDAVRVISGDPGAGKSSFARMYAAHRLSLGERVLFVPLHRLDVEGDLSECIARLCEEGDPYPKVNLDGDLAEGSLLLILDGLDELAKQGHTGARLADEFVAAVLRKVGNRNMSTLRLRVLISGRPISVQGVQSSFRKTGQVLHLLPYCVTDIERRQSSWIDDSGLLAEDQRDAWWEHYGMYSGRGHTALPEPLRGEALVETTRQPLLSYLLAVVYEDALTQGKDFDKDVSRNEIYEHLINRVHARDWGKPGGGHSLLGGLEGPGFRELLEDMALAAWHDGERVTTVAALERLPGGHELAGQVRKCAGISGGIGQLFAAFYMRRRDDRSGGEETFEFTHKSFAEYLTACRLVAQVEIAAQDLEAREQAPSGRRGRTAVKSISDVLLEWLRICGPAAISRDLLPYLHKEVALRNAEVEGRAKVWQAALIHLIEHTLHDGPPCERLDPPLRFGEAREWARNAEEALLVMLWWCAEASKELSKITWPTPTSFGTWFRRLQVQPARGEAGVEIARRCLGWLDVGNQDCTTIDFFAANLQHASLHNTDLQCANLRFTNLQNANLQHANLQRANLQGANLQGANLQDAGLQYANLQDAGLQYANLQDAGLQYANLQDAGLQCANLHDANLQEANLRFANLQDANLQDANLQDTNLQDANLTPDQLAGTKGIPTHPPT